MTKVRHLVSRVSIRSTPERVWQELTKTGEPQQAVFNAMLHVQDSTPGAMLQLRTVDDRYVLAIGRILEYDPPQRYAHTFRFVHFDDPDCTLRYGIAPGDGSVEVSLTIDDLPAGTPTEKEMMRGATMILSTLQAVAETGRPKASVRLMYAMFARMGFLLPRRTRAENWPMTGDASSRGAMSPLASAVGNARNRSESPQSGADR